MPEFLVTPKDAPLSPTIEQEGPKSTDEVEDGNAQNPGKAKRNKTQQVSTWDPEMVVESSGLVNRPGLCRFMDLRELKQPPGLEFDVPTMSLSLSPSFLQNLHFHPPTHHKTRPWIEKALLQRTSSWTKLELVDKKRVEHHDTTINRTSKRHRGNTYSHLLLLQNASSSTQKHTHQPGIARWARGVAPFIPERLYGHLDGTVPEDMEIYVEDHRSYVKDHDERIVSCIWVAINASYSVSMRAFSELANDNKPNPDWDVLTPALRNFSKWLLDTCKNQRPNHLQYRATNRYNPRLYIPLLKDMIPPGHDVPVVFAFRQKYLLFILKGGINGKLVAQYESFWLPVRDASDVYVDKEINKMQVKLLRAGADMYAICKS